MPAPNNISANWQNAGLNPIGGIPNRTTVCATVNPIGGGRSDTANIQAAINGCTAGQVVMLGSSSCLPTCAFSVSVNDSFIGLGTGITVRGAGTCSNTSPPYCQTSITQIDGLNPFGVPSLCGNSGPCATNPIFYVAPAGSHYNISWAQCNGIPTGVGCGGVPLATDVSQGQTTIQVASTSQFTVNSEVLIAEQSAAGWQPDPLNGPPVNSGCGSIWAAPDWLSSSPSPATGRVEYAKGENYGTGNCNGAPWGDYGTSLYPYQPNTFSCNYGSFCDQNTNEIHQIASIGAGPCPGTNCTLTFTDPVTVAFRQSGSHNAQVYAGPYDASGTHYFGLLQQAGIENLSILRASSGTITINYCGYCWLKNVEMSEWGGGGIEISSSWRVQLEGIVADTIWASQNNGAEYPVALDGGSTEILIENSIINRAGKGGVARSGGAGSVWAYNYIDDTFYQTGPNLIGDYWGDEGANASHLDGPHHVLFEGNWAENCDNDNTHGNNTYLAYFRNQCSGLRTPFLDNSHNNAQVNDQTGVGYSGTSGTIQPATPGPLRAAGLQAYNYWHAFVGNVLGTPGVTTTANRWVYTAQYGASHAMWETYGDPYLNGTSGNYFFRHGNYDYVNGSIVDYQSGYLQTFPNSLYLPNSGSSAPAFFGTGTTGCTYPWPWINSQASPPIGTASGPGSCTSYPGLPAKARWMAGTPMVQP
jgi:hypothetical protein